MDFVTIHLSESILVIRCSSISSISLATIPDKFNNYRLTIYTTDKEFTYTKILLDGHSSTPGLRSAYLSSIIEACGKGSEVQSFKHFIEHYINTK